VTQRERFLRCMKFEPVDRIPLMEMGLWPETLDRWHREGLPLWVTNLRQLEDHLDLDISFNLNWLPINDLFQPPFELRVIEETAEDEVVQDDRGTILRRRKSFGSIPQFLRFPVVTEADYDHLLPRLDGADPARYPADFDEDLRWRRARGEIVGVNFRSFFGFARILMGLENLSVAWYEQPALVRRIIADRVRFAKALLARVLKDGAVDFVQIWEDMAYKTASLVSPKLVRELLLPAYVELVAFLRKGGVRLISVDCDGHVLELLPIYREAGIDGIHPCEIAADSDPNLLRRIDPRVSLIGGMDKRAIAAGREGVEAELRRVAPVLKQGGFIPCLDHFVPPDVSYDIYRYYVDRRREVLAKG
jgi:hypothetical protein